MRNAEEGQKDKSVAGVIKFTILSQIRNLWTHASTALEGNTLSLEDTAFVLEEGLTVSGKSLKDHEEVVGHAKAIELVYQLLDIDKFTETELFTLHKVILTERVMDIYKPVGGWKKAPNYTSYVSIRMESNQYVNISHRNTLQN